MSKVVKYQVGPDSMGDYGCEKYQWVVYWYEIGDYEGEGEAVSFDGEVLREHNLSHCSCYGPEDGMISGDIIQLNDLTSDDVHATKLRPEVVSKVLELMQSASPKRKPVVYVASPYTKGDPCINTHFQMQIFNKMLDDGIVVPLIPLFSHFLHTCHPRDYQDWIDYDLDLLHVVDACVRLNAENVSMNYRQCESSGADGEVKRCVELGKPVFNSIPELYAWAKEFLA